MGILYTSGLFTVKGAKEGVIGRAFYKMCGGRGPPEWAPLLRMVELNVLDINFIIFHNSSHSRLTGGGRESAAMISGKLYWILS